MGEEKVKPKKRSFIKKVRQRCESFANKARYAVVGCAYCLRRPKYLVAFLLCFFFFAFFLTFFKDGNGNWQLLWSGLSLGYKVEMLDRVALAIFSNFTSLYGLSIIFLALLQALALVLIIFTWRNRQKDVALNGAGTGGIASLFGFAALGCPTCGISILTPILTAIAGAGATILAERIGIILAIVAFLLLFYAIIRLGYTAFVIVGLNRKKEK